LSKEKIANKLDNVFNYLYKDVPVFKTLFYLIWIFILIILIKATLVGFDKKLFDPFQTLVLGFLILLSFYVFYQIKVKGYGNICFSIIIIGAMFFMLFDYNFPYLASSVISLFFSFHIFYLIMPSLFKILSSKKGIK